MRPLTILIGVTPIAFPPIEHFAQHPTTTYLRSFLSVPLLSAVRLFHGEANDNLDLQNIGMNTDMARISVTELMFSANKIIEEYNLGFVSVI